jgi:hypothetical protein
VKGFNWLETETINNVMNLEVPQKEKFLTDISVTSKEVFSSTDLLS